MHPGTSPCNKARTSQLNFRQVSSCLQRTTDFRLALMSCSRPRWHSSTLFAWLGLNLAYDHMHAGVARSPRVCLSLPQNVKPNVARETIRNIQNGVFFYGHWIFVLSSCLGKLCKGVKTGVKICRKEHSHHAGAVVMGMLAHVLGQLKDSWLLSLIPQRQVRIFLFSNPDIRLFTALHIAW